MKAFEKRPLGKTGEKVTFLGFGALEIGRDWGLGNADQKRRPDEQTACKVLNGVLDMGINIIDTARAYHRSEERIGLCIGHRRKEYFLASKCGEHSCEPDTYYDFSYDAVKKSIDMSLKLLKTDCIDLMQIHFGPDPHKVLDDGETLAAMKDAQKEGKIRFLGASCDGDVAKRCIQSGEFDVIQMHYNLLHRDNSENIEECGKKGIGVLIRGGLGAGLLTPRVIPHLNEIQEKEKIAALLDLVKGNGDMLTAIALNFLYRNDNISSVLVGSKNPDHVMDNVKLLEVEISEDVYNEALKIAGIN
ncbi:aldo/keto reductase [Caldanaerobius polysaccharolyticus]|uniref:aldo/keto reductase n=1 Tax=Caldanaerobius polysaccharolyticus TaxID=44256 RepID=UPI0004791D27|nr:aldo/keto reductase [Caldanaerobius polysaccharolyticus]